MRAFFVVAALSAVKVHAEAVQENKVHRDKGNQFVYSDPPVFKDAFTPGSADYTHPIHPHSDGGAIESPHLEARYIKVPIEDIHHEGSSKYIEIPEIIVPQVYEIVV
jgi:hypothetical protein